MHASGGDDLLDQVVFCLESAVMLARNVGPQVCVFVLVCALACACACA
jgi:hypothetical protein